jgi:hypothetical protein
MTNGMPTRVAEIDEPDVTVDLAAGQYLSYRVEVRGGTPLFNFVSQKKELTASDITGHPQQVYQWPWGQDAADVGDNRERHGVGFFFTHAVEYKLKVDLRDANGNIIKPLKLVSYQSQDPNARYTEDLVVRT